MGLAEETGRWTDHERFAFLLDAAREFGSTLDEAKIYASLRKLLESVMPLDGVVVSCFDTATGFISAEYVWSDGQELDVSGFPPVRWNPEGRGMQSKVIQTAQAEVFDVAQKVRDPNTKYLQVGPGGANPEPVKEEPASKTAMMAPMILDGQVTGVVQAMSDRSRAYSSEDLEIFKSIALLMTPAWNNARTFQRAGRERRLTDRILDTSPDIIYVFEVATRRITFSNGQLERMLGYRKADLDTMDEATLVDVMHPEDVPILEGILQRSEKASDEELLESEWRIRDASENWHWILNRARVFERDIDGNVSKLLGFATDITERKESERQWRETEDRHRILAEMGPYVVWSATATGEVDYVNSRWDEYFGMPFSPGVDRGPFIHPDDRESSQSEYRHAVEEGIPFEIEYRLRRHDGVYRWFMCRAEPLRNESGEIVRWLGILFDIHDQKETEEALEHRIAERTSELEAAVKELEGFTYSVSHDLRGPLRAISAASMIIREDFGDRLPEEANRHLLRQSEAAKKMGALIDDLLKLSRLGRQELAPTKFDFSAMALEVANELGIVGRTRIDPGMEAYGDPRLLRFVLLNLLENAMKFSPPDGEIRVGSDGREFFVQDQGIGFEMEYVDKIFRPFERLVREEDYPGTGIGLANVQRIVHRHGGRVWAESAPGQGSRFIFTL